MIENLNKYGEVLENVSLKKYNTYRIGGITKYFVMPNDIESLQKLIKYLNENEIKHMILGNGSNVIFSDDIYDGVIIKLDKLNKVEVDGLFLRAQAGVMLPKLVQISVENNLMGLEWAAGIPGTVGGSIVGNAGAYKSEIKEFLLNITVIDSQGNIKIIYPSEIDFKYRHSSFKDELKDLVVVSAVFGLMPGNKEESLKLMEDRRARRMESQPLEYPSAGSVFRNPEGDFAGRIIECDVKLKGKTIGGAKVSEKHANFIINYDNATSQDVKDLIDLIHTKVLETNNIDLIVEQEFINWE
ncbi:MAG: UDP-N-acetylmuramate dehydrogenase [Bacilli bacterium]|nr:UDP-N-acetylmuramate dehydrogenase [Bacilli bacterium]